MTRRHGRLAAQDIDTIGSRWLQGETAVQISAVLGCDKPAISWHVDRAGGLKPRARRRARGQLSLAEREEFSRGLAAGECPAAIARRLGRPHSMISRELARNGGAEVYRASKADAAAWKRTRRPKRCE